MAGIFLPAAANNNRPITATLLTCIPDIGLELSMRHHFYRAILLLSMFAACSGKAAQASGDKENTAQLIEKRPECTVYLQCLASPATDDGTIRTVYEDAKAVYCIKPDV